MKEEEEQGLVQVAGRRLDGWSRQLCLIMEVRFVAYWDVPQSVAAY